MPALPHRALRAISARLRWRLGLRVAAADLEEGSDESVTRFYEGRVTDCAFLLDAGHYEHPRARWIVERVSGGTALEVGCGNGGMTRLLAPRVERLIALDVSDPSLEAVRALGLPKVETVKGLVERYRPDRQFDWIIAAEVIEHLRDPAAAVRRLVEWLAPGGALLLTTPRGHWESDEHLHEFTFGRVCALAAESGADEVHVAHLRDYEQRRRWLVAELRRAGQQAAPDGFEDPAAVAAERARAR